MSSSMRFIRSTKPSDCRWCGECRSLSCGPGFRHAKQLAHLLHQLRLEVPALVRVQCLRRTVAAANAVH
ncbi:hypothetical protein T4A_12811 [Trichinella pseudospiralis]|uniref:Uncharacterized protein n=1 Tax=Trichinella pseudospiralis TaxID=6337 RepID=A0A0V1ITT2_TRIPS|nr:hypothetical protein T4A_12811 [Trichinella pseudospiralis]KRZ26202.1 hypothetical protein T4C_10941 [Trichinella pseudospiralis]